MKTTQHGRAFLYVALVGVLTLGLFTGCATKIAEYRNTAGEVRRCQPNVEAFSMAFLLGLHLARQEGDRYAACKTVLEKQGYVRTPAGQENEETKQMIRDIDTARAESIRKP